MSIRTNGRVNMHKHLGNSTYQVHPVPRLCLKEDEAVLLRVHVITRCRWREDPIDFKGLNALS